MMDVLAQTDAFTTGSGLLVQGLTTGGVVTVPLAGQTSIRIGWIVPRSGKLSPMVEQFVQLLQDSVADSIRFTREVQNALGQKG